MYPQGGEDPHANQGLLNKERDGQLPTAVNATSAKQPGSALQDLKKIWPGELIHLEVPPSDHFSSSWHSMNVMTAHHPALRTLRLCGSITRHTWRASCYPELVCLTKVAQCRLDTAHESSDGVLEV